MTRPPSPFLTEEERRDPISAIASLLARQVVVDHSRGERRTQDEEQATERRDGENPQ